MFSKTNLSESAQVYFSVAAPQRREYLVELIRGQANSVTPIISTMLSHIETQKSRVNDLVLSGKGSTIQEHDIRYMWAETTLVPFIKLGSDVIKEIGSPANQEIAHKLLISDKKTSYLVSLILHNLKPIDSETLTIVDNASQTNGPDKIKGALVLMLGLLLAENGNQKWINFIKEYCQNEHIDWDRFENLTINTILLGLHK